MFIELVDQLRCPRPHEFTFLVASTLEMRGRDIRRGVLGCPTCRERYPIAGGVVDFTGGAARVSTVPPDEDGATLAMRAAALLELGAPGGFAVLAGSWAMAAVPLHRLAEGVHLLLVNPSPEPDDAEGMSIVHAAEGLPVRPGAARGVALDGAHAGTAVLLMSAESLRQGGRLIAPSGATVPDGIEELARDERHWVGARRAPTSPPIGLRKGGNR